MNICIICYSETGNTAAFAKKIEEKLKGRGHNVDFCIVETDVPVDSKNAGRGIQFGFKNLPDCTTSDLVLIGGPVWGFQANPVTIKAVSECRGIEGKRVIPFVTHLFPYPFLGGISASSQIAKAAEGRGAKPLKPIILSRAWHDFDKEAEKGAEEIIKRAEELAK